MIRQGELWQKPVLEADVVYTKREISRGIISYLKPCGICLDPCRGDGAFYDYLPNAEYCEIKEGKDFFDYYNNVEWVIGNPPYSIFKDFLQHSFEIANNVSFLVPTNKIWQRQVVMDMINKWGGVKSIIIYGSGSLIGFPFGFSVGNFHFEKGYSGETKIIMGMSQIKSQINGNVE